jgi:diguanylate cyclase (GGDEF)-like protein/PAS domain S-box-containing protein
MQTSSQHHRFGAHDGLLQHVPDIVYAYNIDGRFTAVNHALELLSGYSSDQLLSMDVEQVVPGTKETILALTSHTNSTTEPILKNLSIATRAGNSIPIEASATYAPEGDTGPTVLVIARDISERRRLQEQLEYFATHDPLTGLLNRRKFEEELQLQLVRARRRSDPGVVLFLDMDHFKDINDLFGHSVGDDLLVNIARLLKEELPTDSVLARSGGDEFTCILPRLREEDAAQTCNRLLASMRREQWQIAGHALRISASIGIAAIPTRGFSTAEQILSRADVAMYKAKENGRDSHATFNAEVDWQAELEVRLAWQQRIVEAIDSDRLVLSLQPILDIQSGVVSQYEVLVRMYTEDDQIVDASEFVPHAERFGLMDAIDRRTLRKAIGIIEAEALEDRRLTLHVNVSGSAVSSGEPLEVLRQELKPGRIDPACIVLELTESQAVSDSGAAKRFASGLKSLGCGFALDDFGVGFSSFHQLKHLPVDLLKIDGSFVKDMQRDNVDWHLVRSIVGAAQALGMKTVCEYVGSEETLDLLRELGVDYAQGHYVGVPQEVAVALNDPSYRHRAA